VIVSHDWLNTLSSIETNVVGQTVHIFFILILGW